MTVNIQTNIFGTYIDMPEIKGYIFASRLKDIFMALKKYRNIFGYQQGQQYLITIQIVPFR